jgi:hypothetical protein
MQLNFLKKDSKNIIDKIINDFDYVSSEIVELPKISITDELSLDNINLEQDDIRNELISRFTPNSILIDILNKYNKTCVFTFIYKTHRINIRYFFKGDIDYSQITMLGLKSLVFCEQNGYKSNINLNYIPHTEEKMLSSEEVIGPSSVNSGFTTFEYNGNRTITIFRKEECEKLLIHELVHYLKLDYAHQNIEQIDINKMFREDFDIDTDNHNINTFEAYTDFIAILYNNVYDSIIHDDDIELKLDNEIRFEKYQVHKILRKYDMIHPLKKLNNGKKIKQSTNVVSYYILKLGLMANYKDTLSRFPLGKSWSENKIREFYNFTISKLEEIAFNPAKKYSVATMRMSYV